MKQPSGRFRQFHRCSSGNSILEAAIVLPLAVALMVGIVDFGLAFRVKAIAEKSMQNAHCFRLTRSACRGSSIG